MAYFQENEAEETRRQASIPVDEEELPQETFIESDYDDGFDSISPDDEEEEPVLSEEERKEIRFRRFRFATGAGNLTAVIAGTLIILVLLALLMNMIGFVMNDMERNFTLFQTRL